MNGGTAQLWWLALVVMLWSDAIGAQTLPPADLRAITNQIQQQEQAQSAQADQRKQDRRAGRRSENAPAQTIDPLAVRPGGPCFTISAIQLSGFEAFGAEPEGHKDLIGQCVEAADVAAALNRINLHYQSLGYITTRAYVPQQTLAEGILVITILPGRVEGLVYADGRSGDRRLNAAFPIRRGDLLDLRALEQGLENINAPQSARAQLELLPGEAPGGSFVQVDVTDQRRLWFDTRLDNTGFDTTGTIKANLNVGYDNLLGLNDQFSLGLNSTPFANRARQYSDALSLSWSLPRGDWLWAVDAGVSAYYMTVSGTLDSYPVEGRSGFLTLSGERLLKRTQTAKTYAYGSLKLNRSRSFIDGFEIESQRRRLTIAALGLRGERTTSTGGKLAWDIGGSFGLPAFDAHVLADSVVDPQFVMWKLRLDYTRPEDAAGMVLRSSLVAQGSADVLPGSEQMSIGGWSTVRGFHDDSMYGDSGLYLRNTLSWEALAREEFTLNLQTGLDFGYIKPSQLRRWSQDYLLGLSVGAELTWRDRTTLTLQIAHAVSRPAENLPNAQPDFEAARTVVYAGLQRRF